MIQNYEVYDDRYLSRLSVHAFQCYIQNFSVYHNSKFTTVCTISADLVKPFNAGGDDKITSGIYTASMKFHRQMTNLQELTFRIDKLYYGNMRIRECIRDNMCCKHCSAYSLRESC